MSPILHLLRRRVLVLVALFSVGLPIFAADPSDSPVIVTQPQSASIEAGTDVTLSVIVESVDPVTYQWYVGESSDTSFPIANSDWDLFITPKLYANASYWVRVTNSAGSTDSATAAITQSILETDGKLVLWGLGDRRLGAMADGYGGHPALSPIPSEIGGVSVSAGEQRSTFLKDNGELWQAGGNLAFENERNRILADAKPVRIATDVSFATATGDNSFVIKHDGTLWGVSSTDSWLITSEVVHCAASSSHYLFVKSDGTLWASGWNQYGQLGDGTTTDRPEPVLIEENVSRVAVGPRRSFFIKNDNTMWAMGDNQFGQLGDGSTDERHNPVLIAGGVVSAASGEWHSIFLKMDGSLWGMGLNLFGELGDGTQTQRESPVSIAQNISHFATGSWHTLFVDADGICWATGQNSLGQLGDGSTDHRLSPVEIASDIVSVAAGQVHSLMVKSDGSIWGMGNNDVGQLGNAENGFYVTPGFVSDEIVNVASSQHHTLFLKDDGTLWAVGDDAYIQGLSYSFTSVSVPIQLAADVANCSLGDNHGAFVKMDGSLWAFGYNGFGQLGDGTFDHRGVPIQIATGVSSVAAAFTHTAFIKTDRSLWTVGHNFTGQLGDLGTVDTMTPVEIASSVVSVAAGVDHTVFVKDDATAWATGGNVFGQLGDATFTERHGPVQVGTNVAAVFAGTNHTLFLHLSGELTGAGVNFQGQLGDGTTENRSSPVLIDTGVRTASADDRNTVFLKNDGTLWGVGSNTLGQLGEQAIFQADILGPIQIAEGVVGIEAGNERTFFLQEVFRPSIDVEPSSHVVDSGDTVALLVQESNVVPVEYQWYLGESGDTSQPINGETTAFLTTPPLTNHGSYWVRVSNLAGSTDSETATITVTGPILREAPQSTNETTGGAFALTVDGGASDGSNPSYQWYRNGVAIEGGIEETYTLPSLQAFHAGAYTVSVTALGITVTSDAATVSVAQPDTSAGRMTSLSTRALSLTGDNLLIPGFFIQGSGTKRLLIRAVGPALAEPRFGVADALPDPQMVVKKFINGAYQDIAFNDDWGTNANVDDLIDVSVELFAFELTPGSADAALLLDLDAGQYTVVSSGADDATGVAIVELYDADGPTSTTKMTSISNRGFVGTGTSVMIPGIVVPNDGPKTLLIRVVGPTLAQDPFNVPGVLDDPVLTVFNGSNAILSNDDWGSDPIMADQTRSVAQSLFAFPLSEGSEDAAFVVTLNPGIYTVVASGANGGTGVALVEVYEVP